MPLNILPFILDNVPTKVTDAAQSLRYNKVSTMLWETKDISYTWSYLPAEDTIFHRHIHIGNFFQPPINYTITESMGNRSYEELVKHGKRFDYLIKPLDYNVSDHAYVVYDHYYSESTSTVKEYLHEIGLHSIGRFGEWEYYNMDVCMDKAMGLAAELEKTYS
jgi:protoporphyrinogen oxidase